MYLFMYVCIYYKLNMHYCTCSMHVKVHFCAIGKYVCSINVAKVCVCVCMCAEFKCMIHARISMP